MRSAAYWSTSRVITPGRMKLADLLQNLAGRLARPAHFLDLARALDRDVAHAASMASTRFMPLRLANLRRTRSPAAARRRCGAAGRASRSNPSAARCARRTAAIRRASVSGSSSVRVVSLPPQHGARRRAVVDVPAHLEAPRRNPRRPRRRLTRSRDLRRVQFQPQHGRQRRCRARPGSRPALPPGRPCAGNRRKRMRRRARPASLPRTPARPVGHEAAVGHVARRFLAERACCAAISLAQHVARRDTGTRHRSVMSRPCVPLPEAGGPSRTRRCGFTKRSDAG